MTYCFLCKKKREKRLQKTKNIKRTWYTLGIFHNKESKSQVIQVQAWGIKAGESHQTSVFLVPHHKMCGRSMVLGPDIPALGKLTGEDCHQFEARLHHRVYIISKQKQTAKQVRHGGQTYSPTLRRWKQKVQDQPGLPRTLSQNKPRCKGWGCTSSIEYRANWHSGLYLLYARAVNYFCQDENKAEKRWTQ